MLYLYIKIIIGSAVHTTHITHNYIVNYDSYTNSKMPRSIIDRRSSKIYRLDTATYSYVVDTIENERNGGWLAEGFISETVLRSQELDVEGFGKVLEVVTNRNNKTNDMVTSTMLVYRFISADNPLIQKYCMISNNIDWRITDNNNNLLNADKFPFLYTKHGVPDGGTPYEIFRIEKFEEREYSTAEMEALKNYVK